jgi:hypothetical protein
VRRVAAASLMHATSVAQQLDVARVVPPRF